MCDNCFILEQIIKYSDSNPHKNYMPTIKFIEEMISQDRIELYAGDCEVKDIKDVLYEEKSYTICHFFKCKSCDGFYFVGACIRGTPIYKKIKNIEKEKIENMVHGTIGTYYKKNKL